jgi:pimeloyl-ACP methyl ester carboxylesterase
MPQRLITIPLQQLESVVSETWSALRGSSRFRDVPPLEASFGLVGEAVLDRTFTLTTSVLTGLPVPERVRRGLEEARAAVALFRERGWLDDPRSYHGDPPPLEVESLTEGAVWTRAGRRRFRHLVFESGFTPHPDEPGRERWLEHPRNATAHAYVLEHDTPRPWLVCVHGFAMGSPLVNFTGFPVRLLHEQLGLNLLFPVLPLHGLRGAGRFSGGEVLDPDYLRMVHLFAQAVWDVRRLIEWLRARGGERIGVYGISLGGYVASLVASIQEGLDCVIAGIPAVDFPNLARDNEPWIMRRYDDELEMDWRLIRAISHPVSPLAFRPRVAREGRFIYAGLADRVVKPDQPRALWRHWEQPAIHWFSGGHVLGLWNASVADFLSRSLEGAGLVRRG